MAKDKDKDKAPSVRESELETIFLGLIQARLVIQRENRLRQGKALFPSSAVEETEAVAHTKDIASLALREVDARGFPTHERSYVIRILGRILGHYVYSVALTRDRSVHLDRLDPPRVSIAIRTAIDVAGSSR